MYGATELFFFNQSILNILGNFLNVGNFGKQIQKLYYLFYLSKIIWGT